ncbi:MAG: type II CAAX prenyl endopeptidase Rce1 family protein, partial [Bacillota bacterium]
MILRILTLSLAFFFCFILFFEKPNILIFNFPSILAGLLVGLLMSLIGYWMLISNKLWADSLSYLVGHALSKGSILTLLVLSTMAGIFEELYTRGILLCIYIKSNTIFSFEFIIFFFIVNSVWVISHIYNRSSDLKVNFRVTLKKSMPHLFAISLSSIPFT